MRLENTMKKEIRVCLGSIMQTSQIDSGNAFRLKESLDRRKCAKKMLGPQSSQLKNKRTYKRGVIY